MAGDFIRWEKGLCMKPEIVQIATRLSIPIPEAAGRCMLVWEWADGATADGYLAGITAEFIDHVAGLKGFARAMEDTRPHGWIILDEIGATIINYEKHNGACAKKRLVDAERKRRNRVTLVTRTCHAPA